MELVRVPSETPNINPADDYRVAYYAVGGQNGFNKDYGTGFNYEINGNEFRVLSGELFLYGVQCRIDGAGEVKVIDPVAEKRYYSIYCEVNLSNDADNRAELKITYDAATYPTIDAGDNLIANRNGIARIELYRFTAVSGVVSDVVKVVNELLGYGERLDKLGFSEVFITDVNPNIRITSSSIYKNGKAIVGAVYIAINKSLSVDSVLFKINSTLESYLPKENNNFNAFVYTGYLQDNRFNVLQDGSVTTPYSLATYQVGTICLFSYIAE